MQPSENFTFLTFNFNNALLTKMWIMSLLKKNELYNILIVDNSTENIESICDLKNVRLFDNTNFKYTKNFKEQITKNHADSINFALLNLITTKYAVLCDNDVLFKPKVSELINDFEEYDAVGEVGYDVWPGDRLFPYFCIINVEKMRNEKIRYFDETRTQVYQNGRWINDTGASFYQDIVKSGWNVKRINIDDYVVHYHHGSQIKECSKKYTYLDFLKENISFL